MDSLNAALLMCAFLIYSLLINPPDMGKLHHVFFPCWGSLRKTKLKPKGQNKDRQGTQLDVSLYTQ